MTLPALLAILVANTAFVGAALVLGELALRGVGRLVGDAGLEPPGLARIGAALLVGFGAVAYTGVALGLLHAFRRPVLIALLVVALGLGRHVLARYVRYVRDRARLARRLLSDPLSLSGVVLAGILFVAGYQHALAPPTLGDALAYHFPEAQIVASTHRLPWTLGGHYLYGNIPKLIEVMLGEGISVAGGFGLASALQVTLAGSFVLFAAGILRSLFDRRTAVLGAVFVLLIGDFLGLASGGYVDTSTAAYEAGAVLLAARWVERRAAGDLGVAAVLVGLALAVKYSAAPTLAFLVVLVVAVLAAERRRLRGAASLLGRLAVLAGAACGFWYLKNLVRFGNPFYPLYLGHPGITEQQYRGVVAAVHAFGPRTLHAFVRVPARYSDLVDLPVLAGIYATPVALLVRRRRAFVATLVAYVPLYTTYWFFLGTHQLRFLMAAAIAAVLLLAVALTQLQTPAARLALAAVAVAAIALGSPHAFSRASLGAGAREALRTDSWRFVAGRESQTAYLEHAFGCSAAAIAYLHEHRVAGNVVDDWTIWHDIALTLYYGRNRFAPFAPSRPGAIWPELRRGDFRYLYVRQGPKRLFFADTDPQVSAFRRRHRPSFDAILRHATPIWRRQDCSLYRIVPPRAG